MWHEYYSDVLTLRAGTSAWVNATPMPSPLCGHDCAALDDASSPGFVVAGGFNNRNMWCAESHRYDCASDRWTRLGDMSCDRSSLCAKTLGDGAVYVCGGSGRDWWDSTERLDVRTGTWQVVSPLPVKVEAHAVLQANCWTLSYEILIFAFRAKLLG